MRWICRMYLPEVPIKHKYFFIKAVQVFLGFQLKRALFMKAMHRISKFTILESSTLKKVFLCTSDSFFFIGDYIYFTLNTSSHPEVFLRKGVLKICGKFRGEYPCWGVISIKLQSSFMETTLRHGCSPVNLLYIFRTPFPKNTPGLLLLYKLSLISHKLKIYSGKPDTPCKFTYEKNLISKREFPIYVRFPIE